MFGIRRGLKRGVSKLVNRGKSTPDQPAATSAAPSTPKPAPAPRPAPKPAAVPEVKAAPVAASEPAVEAAPAAHVPKAPPTPSKKAEPKKPALSGIAAMIAAGAAAEQDEIDLSVSYTSGPAAEAAAAAMAARDMINTAEDGETYWGPIDNDSSRSKAAGQTLIIDQWECIHCGTCVENTEQVFVLPDDSKAVVIRQEGPMELIQDAIDACPVTCIHWTDDPNEYEQINDAEGNPIGDAA